MTVTAPVEFALAEGMEVAVVDDAGRQHHGIISAVVTQGAELLYTVLLTCRGVVTEINVPESGVLARLRLADY